MKLPTSEIQSSSRRSSLLPRRCGAESTTTSDRKRSGIERLRWREREQMLPRRLPKASCRGPATDRLCRIRGWGYCCSNKISLRQQRKPLLLIMCSHSNQPLKQAKKTMPGAAVLTRLKNALRNPGLLMLRNLSRRNINNSSSIGSPASIRTTCDRQRSYQSSRKICLRSSGPTVATSWAQTLRAA